MTLKHGLNKNRHEHNASFAPPPRKRRWRSILVSALLLYGFYWVYFPRVDHLNTENPKTTAFMARYQETQRASAADDRIQYRWRPLSEISPYLKNAVLISEDDTFFKHDGINVDQIKLSIEAWRKGKKLRGASTITQQLAKNLYLSPSRNPLRKLREFLIARRLEAFLTKPRILELYLNVIEWGRGIYGAQAASQAYFHKDADALSAREAAYLAAIIPNPVVLTQKSQARRVKNRESMILGRLNRYSPKFLD